MGMFFLNQARNAADTDYLGWVSTCLPDTEGEDAPAAILADSVTALAAWGSRPTTFYRMRARNAGGSAYVSWTVEGAPDTTGSEAPGGPSAVNLATIIVAASYTAGDAETPARDELLEPTGTNDNQIVWPLTYDEEDANGYHHLTRTAGSPITPEGFYCNGVDSRLMLSEMPSWQDAASESFSLFAIVTPGLWTGASVEALLSLGVSGSDQPKLELAKIQDNSKSTVGQLALRIYTGSIQTIRMQRLGWSFEFRMLEDLAGTLPFCQALLFLDDSTLLCAGHWNDLETFLYRFDLTTGECTGKATTTEFEHIGGLAMFTDGGGDHVWACYNLNEESIELDLDRSFLCGEVHVKARWSHPPLQANGGISFLTTGGQDYVLLSQFANDGVTTVYVWVFLRSQMSAPVDPTIVGGGGRVARYDIGQTIQSTTVRASDNLLYATRNRAQGVAPGSGTGNIQSYDLAAAIAGAPGNDGAALSPVGTWDTPSQFPEGIGFRPSDDRCWSQTEGLATAGDLREWSGAVWSADLDDPEAAVETEILVDYDGPSDVYEVRQNGRLWGTFSLNPTTAPTRLSIGANPNASAGWASGFGFDTLIRSVALKDRPFTESEIETLRDDAGEAHTLTEYPLSITNPGAEAGSTTGWTDELAGLLNVRSASPAPFAGSFYFSSGNSVNNRSRQRFTLATITGFSNEQIDEQCALQMWGARVEWQQASFDGSTDPGGMGIRTLDSTPAEILLTTSTEVSIAPSQTWRPRARGVPLIAPARGLDLIQHRTRTSGTNVDCYVDSIEARLLSREHERGTTPVALTAALDDSSSTNADLSTVVGTNPLSVKGPKGTDFAVAFGIGRAYQGPATTGPHTTFTGSVWTWECMLFISEYPAVNSILYLIGNSAGTDSDSNNNTVFQITITTTGQLLGFWEEGAGVNHTLLSSSTYRLPIGRWIHVGFIGTDTGANRTLDLYETLPGGSRVLVSTDSAVKQTGGANRIVQLGGTAANPFIGKLAYVRISNIARSASEFANAAADPANIANDANTTGLYLCQGRT